MIVNRRGHEAGSGFVHTALIAGTDDEVIDALVPALRRSASTYDEVLMVVGKHTRALLAGHVDDLAGVLRWDDVAAFYRRLGFAYESFRRYLAEQAEAGRRVHVIAEPDLADKSDADPPPGRAEAYLAYEAVCNDTYAPYRFPVTCLWDTRHHSAAVIEGVQATHPRLLTPAGPQPSPHYRQPDQYLTLRSHVTLPPVPRAVSHDQILSEVAQLSRLRALLNAWAGDNGFAEESADDLVVTAVEIASNALCHAATPVRVRAWRHDDTLVVQCDDTAGIPIPATAGYHRPDTTGALPGGRGLWLARQLADVVLIDSHAGRTSIRLHFPHDVMHRG
ncbi:sensor histidine kinase [Actinoplanes utahensis]|uniref:Anti-sigma regulatory factor n=1 Tax=Actinoplanes utahensis TaxID=1869 RepID=A0A0A6UQZ9_ACTUT|nr:sensor histidine kinase [Actinoplanes utahensis]KHD77841.1 hypothetical protein MB27_08595 [Actinoplanes utahensis]GIF32485.1 hypothetical protein Aut01nite_54710 [Actinoplanes utahensis]